MEETYERLAKTLKAISEPKRLKIVDMLSCGELCACQILEEFQVTQPTLSHDMKVLVEAGLVRSRRDGKNTYYSLNDRNLRALQKSLYDISHEKEDCICRRTSGKCCC